MINVLEAKEANKKLIEEYPFLLPRNRFTDKIPEDYDYSFTELDDECPQGWTKLKLDFYKELKPLLIKANYLDKFRIMQSKEKYGYWHLYTNGIPEEISKEYYDLFKKYEKLSEHTCIFCGEKAKMCDFGWISPICRSCWDKGKISSTRTYDEVVDKSNIPKDITYCNFKNCNRDCERNISYHDFFGEIFSIAQFDKVEGFSEETCEYFYPMEDSYESSKM